MTTPQPGKHSAAVDPLPLRLQSLIEYQIRSGALATKPEVHVLGVDSPLPLAALLASPGAGQLGDRPHVVVFEKEEDAAAFASSLAFFDPSATARCLPAFDVDLYSNLYPNPRDISRRVRWLHMAQNARPGQVFVASLQALLQRTVPFQVLKAHTHEFLKNGALPDPLPPFLEKLGYAASPVVEDIGTYSLRGGILDIYSPAHEWPVRVELFGDIVDSLRTFDPETQRSLESIDRLVIVPPREVLFSDENRQVVAQGFRESLEGQNLPREDIQPVLHSISQGQYFPGIDFLLPLFYERLEQPLEHFSSGVNLWLLSPLETTRSYDLFLAKTKEEFETGEGLTLNLDYRRFYAGVDEMYVPPDSLRLHLSKIEIQDTIEEVAENRIDYRSAPLTDFANGCINFSADSQKLGAFAAERIRGWKDQDYAIFIATHTTSQSQRLRVILEKAGLDAAIVGDAEYLWAQWREEQIRAPNRIHIVPRPLRESLRLVEENLVFLREEDFFGRKKSVSRRHKESGTLEQRAHALSFGDLKPGDLIVHKQHGVGVYEGLKVMPINGIESELIQLAYKDGDKLYLPVYRIGQIQKYAGPGAQRLLDKLGGQGWMKAQTKVRSQLRDLAAELLDLYAKRSQLTRPPFSPPDEDYLNFESMFPYDETDDQLRAIEDILKDMTSDRPMDRLVCGDVGFGKTEVAMRAAFKAVQDGRQVAVIAPTTVLAFQHYETFKKRFKNWPVTIRALNRFVEPSEVKKTLEAAKSGQVDILIGTHRIFSRDVSFANLGLLIVDEEQKFGVKHKEKIRKTRVGVDTLVLSATPIPRTLNLSLVGIRDLSLINTAPVDRLPTRTFVTRFEKATIRKAVLSELSRGGQVFFLHNRVQSIYGLLDELRTIIPEARMAVAHGQMEEDSLERTMMSFFNHEIDVLVCTTIIESGVDIPRANTMFIDNAHQFGLSQLYQLRGRVGRSKERAYCYLLIPSNRRVDADAQERLRVIQENTALGSGIRIAQHDLELRGSGDILGEDQSGHINAVGYELYMELLEEAIRAQRGDSVEVGTPVEPDINVRIPALIPDAYISDLRIRLSYYKALSEIQGPEDLDRIEDELRDQFGAPPEPVVNLMGLMLIRKDCKDLGVRDLSAGTARVSLSFTESTPLPPAKVVELSTRENKKYAITPDNRLNIRMNEITWPRIYDELQYLKRLCP